MSLSDLLNDVLLYEKYRSNIFTMTKNIHELYNLLFKLVVDIFKTSVELGSIAM